MNILYGLMLLLPLPAAALTLSQAWFMALDNDPRYQAAVKEKLAGEEYISIGRAGLLPKVSMSYQRAPRNWQKQQYPQTNIFGQQSQAVQHRQYASNSGSLTLVQPLFDYEAYARYRIGIVQKLQSDERYRSDVIDLQNRLIDAWLGLAEAEQQLQLAVLRRRALDKQQQLAQRQHHAGEGTITDITEARSALSIAIAGELDATESLNTAREALSAITGAELSGQQPLPVLNDRPLLLPLVSTHYQYWEKKAFSRNPDILTAGLNVEEKRHEIESNRAGFFPRLQLYAMHAENDSDNDNTVHQKYRTDSVGLRVSMDIFSGGGGSASTRQAVARYEQAQYLHDALRLKIRGEIKTLLNKCLHAPVKIKAYTSAVESARELVDATRKSIQAGQRTNIDLLNAEQTLYQARVELSVEKHAVIKAWVGLLAKTGEINSDSIMLLDAYFAREINKLTGD